MQPLKQKISSTTLFSDEDKIAILAAIDTYSSEDTKALENIIDEFDSKHKAAISEYKSSVYGVLDDIVKKAILLTRNASNLPPLPSRVGSMRCLRRKNT